MVHGVEVPLIKPDQQAVRVANAKQNEYAVPAASRMKKLQNATIEEKVVPM